MLENNKNQDLKKKPKPKQKSKPKEMFESLADIVRSEMIGKGQIPGKLKRGNGFCMSGLLCNHIIPDVDIECDSWNGITVLVNRYPDHFSEDYYYGSPLCNGSTIKHYIQSFKEYYQKTGKINLRLIANINDYSFSNGHGHPFTFEDFANLFQELGITIKKLDRIAKYKEDTVLSIDNVTLVEDKKPQLEVPNTSNPFGFGNHIENVNVNVNLDPELLSSLISQHVSKMLFETGNNTIPKSSGYPTTTDTGMKWKTRIEESPK